MKKTIVLLLALILTLTLVACGGNECKHIDANTDGKCDECGEVVGTCAHEDANTDKKCDKCGETLDAATGDDLVLVAGKETKFAVLSADAISDRSEGYVNDFVKKLNKYYLEDQNLKINYDVKGFEDAVEIIFGSTANRGDAFKKDEHYLGYKGFSVEVIGNKLFVLGGGEKGYQNAIKYLEDTLFNLESYGEDVIDELVIPAGTKYESIPTDYNITEFTVDGRDIKNFVLTYTKDSKAAKAAATLLQETVYKEAGVWLPYVAISDVTADQKTIYVEFTKGDAARTTENGTTVYVKDGDLYIECEFENKIEEIVQDVIDSKLSVAKVKIPSNYTYTKDVRNIYYKDFGAIGDGVTDDFFAIKACHEYANKYGHTVNGTEGHTYYIGIANGTESIPVKTDTYWNLASFIWDDRDVPDPTESNAYRANIFRILPSKDSTTLSGSKLPVTSIPSGSATIGDWKPGERVLVAIYDNTKRQYIRFGANQDNGQAQTEMILVNADGTIDPSTPVQWDYTTLSKMVVYPCDEAPLTFSGGYKDQTDNYSAMGRFDNFDVIDRATVETYFNDAPSTYKYFYRNIQVTRSNVTVKNIRHVLHDDVEQSAPYHGFIAILNATDITVEGMIFQKQKTFSTVGSSGDNVGMGSYEIQAESSNNVTWQHCRQSNFFEPNGSVKSRGYMNTDYCRNLTFRDMLSCSFDAHKNLYNAQIIDVTAEHLNFIGAGDILVNNVTVYTDGNAAGIIFRGDYGSTWYGNVKIDGLTLRSSMESELVSIIKTFYYNHYFGFTCHLPTKIELNNIKIVEYGYKMENGVRTEWDIATNAKPLSLLRNLEGYSMDISSTDADMSSFPNDWTQCRCHEVYNGTKSFNDTDGDGRCNNDLNPNDSYTVWCWGFENKPDTTKNANPYSPTEEIYITNCGNLTIIVPGTPQFKNTKVYIDGVLQD